MKSIHFEILEEIKPLTQDQKSIIKYYDLMREICNAVLSLRKKHKLRVRMPLSDIVIVANNDAISLDEEMLDVIKSETNIENIILNKSNVDKITHKVVKINFASYAPKVGAEIKNIMQLIKNNEYSIIDDETVKVGENIIKRPDFEITLQITKDAFDKRYDYAITSSGMVVALNTELTEELINEGLFRDVVRQVQEFRKTSSLSRSDYVDLEISLFNQNLFSILEKKVTLLEELTNSKSIKITLDKTNVIQNEDQLTENLVHIKTL